jgi:hypothetical protein
MKESEACEAGDREINLKIPLFKLDAEAAKQPDRVLAPRAAKRSVGNRT